MCKVENVFGITILHVVEDSGVMILYNLCEKSCVLQSIDILLQHLMNPTIL